MASRARSELSEESDQDCLIPEGKGENDDGDFT